MTFRGSRSTGPSLFEPVILFRHGELDGEDSAAVVPWWSFTKTVIAAAVVALAKDGRLDLDAPMPHQPFTLRQLLRHEAGLADYGELVDYHSDVARGASPWSLEEMLLRLDAGRLRYAPGSGWRYSNVGYAYVVEVIAKITGKTLEEALFESVFGPLEISGARIARTPEALAGVDMGDSHGYDPGWVYHGLLVGPISAAAKCLDGIVSGKLFGAPWLSQLTDTRKLDPIRSRPWVRPAYGLGLMHSEVKGRLVVSGHTEWALAA